MKLKIFATAAIPAAIFAVSGAFFPAHASGDLGCETVDKGGYFNLADPYCVQNIKGTPFPAPEDRDDRNEEGVAEPEDEETEDSIS